MSANVSALQDITSGANNTFTPKKRKSEAAPSTPSKVAKFAFSPNNQASPFIPNPPHRYHHGNEVMTTVPKRELRSFRNKKAHTLEITSPEMGKILPKAHSFISKARKHIAKGNGAPPPYQASPGTEVIVKKVDEVTVRRLKNGCERVYGIHEQITPAGARRASFFPKSGDGTIVFEKGILSPAKLENIVTAFRATSDKSVHPIRFLQDRVNQLLPNSAEI